MPRASMREQIVDAAMDRFHELGFNGCGVKEITDAARVPKGSFYNHFDSKEALALEVLRRYEADCAMEMLSDASIDPVARVEAFFRSLSSSLRRFGYSRGCLFGNIGSEMADHSEAIRDQVAGSLDHWAKAVAVPLREAGVAADADLLARFIVDAWQGAVIRAKVARDKAPLDDFFTLVFGTLLG